MLLYNRSVDDTKIFHRNLLPLLGVLLSSVAYFQLAQLEDRTDSFELLIFCNLAFVGLGCLLRSRLSFTILLLLGLLFRFFSGITSLNYRRTFTVFYGMDNYKYWESIHTLTHQKHF